MAHTTGHNNVWHPPAELEARVQKSRDRVTAAWRFNCFELLREPSEGHRKFKVHNIIYDYASINL